MIPLSDTAAGLALAVRVIPRAGRTGVAGIRGDALLVRLAAAPVDGAANDALVAYLSSLLDVARRDITLLSGQTSRDKRIAIAGVGRADLEARLSDILPDSP